MIELIIIYYFFETLFELFKKDNIEKLFTIGTKLCFIKP